jgi:hypothetical protein
MAAYCLRYSGPGQAWQILPINRSEFNLGRAEGNDLVLPSALISRQHARLYIQGDQIWLLDLNSSNGTFSSGQRIPPNQWVRLVPGQVIQIGEFYLCLDLVQDQAPVLPAYPAVPMNWQPPQAPLTPAYPPAAPGYPATPPAAGPARQVRARPASDRPRLLPWLIGAAVLLVLVVIFAAVQWAFKQNLVRLVTAFARQKTL